MPYRPVYDGGLYQGSSGSGTAQDPLVPTSLSDPASHAALVTPNDAADLPGGAACLLVGTSGALKVTTAGGETLTLPAEAVVAGAVLPLRVVRVWSTGTTADDVVALW